METHSVLGSQSYIWYTKDILGQGATGAVYKGRHRRTGEVYAIKTFSSLGYMRSHGVQMREFDVLRKLKHDNIVKLLTIEEENVSKEKVLVMELCAGGSLYNILEEPENGFGLAENEFLGVLRDVAAGMKHLRDNGIVHRDIKPGNIMRHVQDDGRSVYKLIDFGAARELQEEEQFMSLYGTEEYLHPDMYERAVLRRPMNKPFTASVDLWSLGVTLYHVATGQLPFRPFGGRKNQETMYRITTQKLSGVISGIQKTDAGEIEWSREMPTSCQLSKGLKLLITPLLAGLMECDVNFMWSFEQFFEEVEAILRKKIVVVFSMVSVNEIHVFAEPNAGLAMFQELVAQQVSVHPSHQLLLYENYPFSQLVTPLQTVSNYPVTSSDNPIFLFMKNSADDMQLTSEKEIKFPYMQAAQVSTNEDASLAKTCCGIIHYMYRLCKQCIRSQALVKRAARMFLLVYAKQLDHVREIILPIERYFEEIRKREQLLLLLQQSQPASTVQSRISNSMMESFQNLTKTCLEHCQYRNEENHLQALDQNGCQDSDRCIKKLELIVKSAEEIWNQFKRNKQLKKLNHNEEQIQRFDKIKLQSLCNKTSSLLYGHCYKQEDVVFSKCKSWCSLIVEKSRKLADVEQRIDEFAESLLQLAREFDEDQSALFSLGPQGQNQISMQQERLFVSADVTERKKSRKRNVVNNLQDVLEQLTKETSDLDKIMQENHFLMTRLGDIGKLPMETSLGLFSEDITD